MRRKRPPAGRSSGTRPLQCQPDACRTYRSIGVTGASDLLAPSNRTRMQCASSSPTSRAPLIGRTDRGLAGSKKSRTSSFCPTSSPETRARIIDKIYVVPASTGNGRRKKT
jgi:hypothetical protein